MGPDLWKMNTVKNINSQIDLVAEESYSPSTRVREEDNAELETVTTVISYIMAVYITCGHIDTFCISEE